MTNLYRIEDPALISFSGGRTSAYLLRHVLDAHEGALPDGVIACFANTGQEMPQTLDFVRDCAQRWSVNIIWLEYERTGQKQRNFRVVSHARASRHGEPFEAVIRQAIAAWDAEGHVNGCGVFARYETENVAKHGQAVAEVGIYKLRDGVFVHCCHFTSATAGFGYAPDVWRPTPHETAKRARQAAIAELLERIGEAAPGAAKADGEDLRRVRWQLQRLVEQPSLF